MKAESGTNKNREHNCQRKKMLCKQLVPAAIECLARRVHAHGTRNVSHKKRRYWCAKHVRHGNAVNDAFPQPFRREKTRAEAHKRVHCVWRKYRVIDECIILVIENNQPANARKLYDASSANANNVQEASTTRAAPTDVCVCVRLMRATAFVYTDGASRGNPGRGSYGCWVHELGRRTYGIGVYLGERVTNNEAEYQGVIRGLELAHSLLNDADDIDRVVVATDSKLVVEQLAGRYAVRAEGLRAHHSRARGLASRDAIDVRHVRRAANSLADAMANRALDYAANVRVDGAVATVKVGDKRSRK
jgi:probable phosphoglycerate mutase